MTLSVSSPVEAIVDTRRSAFSRKRSGKLKALVEPLPEYSNAVAFGTELVMEMPRC
jgi:hypothetical protein